MIQGSNEVGEQKTDKYYEKSENREPKIHVSIKKLNSEGLKSGEASFYKPNSSENAKTEAPRALTSLNTESESQSIEKLIQFVENLKLRNPKSVQDAYIPKPEIIREKPSRQHQNYNSLKPEDNPELNHSPENISSDIQKKANKNSQRKVIYVKI